jgi:putative acetyltransferase
MTISIRAANIDDFQAIKAIYAQPNCYANTFQLPYPSDDLWHERLKEYDSNHHSLVALIDGVIVGQIGLLVCATPRRKHVADIGMGVSGSHQGKGVGDALLAAVIDLAINWLAVTRIELGVYTDNAAAIGLYKKHGFEMEGTAKKYAFRDGKYVDTYFMAKVI